MGSYAIRWRALRLSQTPAEHMPGTQTNQGRGKITVFLKECVYLNKSLPRKGLSKAIDINPFRTLALEVPRAVV